MNNEQPDNTQDSLSDYFITDPHEIVNDDPAPQQRLRRIIPNLLTLCGLAAGLLAIQKAMLGAWDMAVLLVVFAAVVDAMDGAMARLLNATSRFGAELDSLADFLSFGVAPALIIYLWALSDAGPLGWVATLVFAMACALRLARFNSMSEDDPRPVWARKFFMGVPAPGAAGLALMPVIFSQAVPETRELAPLAPFIGVWMLIVAALMVSRMPTFSSKQIKLPKSPVVPVLAFAIVLIASMVHAPWTTLSVISAIYVCLIPVGWQTYNRLKRKHAQA